MGKPIVTDEEFELQMQLLRERNQKWKQSKQKPTLIEELKAKQKNLVLTNAAFARMLGISRARLHGIYKQGYVDYDFLLELINLANEYEKNKV